MKQSSINFKPVTSYSEEHNQRLTVPDYVIPGNDKIPPNIKIVNESISSRLEKIKALYSQEVKQKWQTQMTPIKEAVIVLDKACFHDSEGKYSNNGIKTRIKTLNALLNARYGIECFQTYVHFDEGKKMDSGAITPLWERNLHAHLVFDWQLKTDRIKINKEGKETVHKAGTMAKLGKKEMRDIQTITAEVMGLERGKFNSKAERLEHGEYREKMKQLEEELQAKKLRLAELMNNAKKLKTTYEKLLPEYQKLKQS